MSLELFDVNGPGRTDVDDPDAAEALEELDRELAEKRAAAYSDLSGYDHERDPEDDKREDE